MSSKQETVADIVAAMRNESHSGDESCLEWVGAKMRTYADRIEAAAKREREAGAEAAQICGKIGEMIGREAACKQSVTDCNHLGNAAELLAENARLRAALKPVLECKVMSAMTAEVRPGRSEYCATIIEKVQHIYNKGEARQKKGGAK